MRHGKRRDLTCADIDNSLKVKNIEPLYGFECADYIPLRHSSGGGKDIYYPDDQEIDLVNLVSSPLPKLPCDVILRSHWLAVEGVQPMIPENIPPVTFKEQKELSISRVLPNGNDVVVQSKDVRLDRKRKNKESESSVASGEWTKLRPLQSHGLSMEQQVYYKELCDACVGMSDGKRQEALTSLSTDPGLYQLLPHLTSFISEGIKVNIAQRKLSSLKNLLRMTKSLLDNDTISIEKYLHELIPTVLSCVLNRLLCTRPEAEDHWSIRDQGAKILAHICTKYSNSVNNIQTRVTRILSQSLLTNKGLAIHYGAVVAFAELGPELIRTCVIPRLKGEGEFIKMSQGASNGHSRLSEQIAANKLQAILQKHCAPLILLVRLPTDTVQVFQNEYGHLGNAMFTQVKALRQGRTLSTSQRPAKSPTSPLGGKLKPPPLSIPTTHVTATKIQTPKGATLSISPQNLAALRVQLAQATSPQGGSPVHSPIATIPVSSLLSVVVSNPSVAQAVLASQLNNAASTSINNGTNNTTATTTTTSNSNTTPVDNTTTSTD